MFQAKRPREKRWRSLRGYLEAIHISPSAFDEEPTTHYELATFHHKRGDPIYIRRGDRARVLILNKVVNARDKTVAKRWFAKRAKIYRGRGKPVSE